MRTNFANPVAPSVTSMLDHNFLGFMLEVEKGYGRLGKHERIRIEQWSKKLCQPTSNTMWKKNRNLYAMLLLDQVLNERLDKPFAALPPETGLPSLSEVEVKARLSGRFNAVRLELSKSSPSKRLKEMEGEVVVKRGAKTQTSSPQSRPAGDVHLLRSNFLKINSPLDTRSPYGNSGRIPEEDEEESRHSIDNVSMTVKSDLSKSNTEVLRLKSEIDVLKSTLDHMKEEARSKTEMLAAQRSQLEKLNANYERAVEESRVLKQEMEESQLLEERRQKAEAQEEVSRQGAEGVEMDALNEETGALLERSKVLLNSSVLWDKQHDGRMRAEKRERDFLLQATKDRLRCLDRDLSKLSLQL